MLLIGVLVRGGVAAEQKNTFGAILTGEEEVPPVATEMSGSVRIRFNDDITAAAFMLTVNDGVRVQHAHIHCGFSESTGQSSCSSPVFMPQGWDVDGKWIDHAVFTKANIVNPACGATLVELTQSMKDGKTYANVHTVAHPGGKSADRSCRSDAG